jgi:hypothetical protein
MEGLPQDGIIAPQITRHRVYLALWSCLDSLYGPSDLVKQGQPITRIPRIPWGHEGGEDKTGRGFRCDAGLSATLCRAMARAFDHRRKGGIVSMDQLTVAELLAVSKPGGLLPDVCMVAHGRGERQRETLALGLT